MCILWYNIWYIKNGKNNLLYDLHFDNYFALKKKHFDNYGQDLCICLPYASLLESLLLLLLFWVSKIVDTKKIKKDYNWSTQLISKRWGKNPQWKV